jgi:Zn-dependent protease with chaperone function
MSRYCSQPACVAEGEPTDLLVCPQCGHETTPPNLPPPPAIPENSSEFGLMQARPPAPVEAPAGPDDQVIFTTIASSEKESKKKFIQRAIVYVYPVVEAVACIALAADGRFPIVFSLGAILSVQQLIIVRRVKKMVGPISEDSDIQARISSVLKELCIAAQCPLPQVTLRRTAIPAGVLAGRSKAILLLSPDFVCSADDESLRAALAHEVSHISSGDLGAAKRRMQSLLLGTYILGLVPVFTLGKSSWIAVFMLIVFFVPFIRVVTLLLGFTIRWRETRADVMGVALTQNTRGMIRGLQLVYELARQNREQIYGRTSLRWTLIPFSIRATTHPPLAERIAHLRAIASMTTDVT